MCFLCSGEKLGINIVLINLTAAYDITPAAMRNSSSVFADEMFSGVTVGDHSVSLLATEAMTEKTMGENNLLFNITVRGVLYCAINFIATFLNVSTIVVTYRYQKLQISSNALLVCFSVGNSLAGITGILSIFTSFVFENTGEPWKIICSIQTFFSLWQQFINIISLTAISIERVYTLYFPLRAYKNNSFERMTKVCVCLLIISFLKTSAEITLGFHYGNFLNRSICLIRTVTGPVVTYYSLVWSFVVFSVVTVFNTGLVVGKAIHLKRKRSDTGAAQTNNMQCMQYKITKLLGTGKCCHFNFRRKRIIL